MSGVQAKKVLAYAVMPGFIPRVRAFFTRGFGYIAFLMANVYNMVRLIPNGHPYLNPANIGRFGIRHVIAEAANRLVISRRNIDQIIVFALLLGAIVLLVLQILTLIYGFLIAHAMATSLFITPVSSTGGASTDVAFTLLDQVFGVPNLFCAGNGGTNCTAIGGTLPLPFHVGLHSLFQFYSTGLLIVGMLIFLYYVIVVVAETAVTGSPFGQRFQNIWVPIRLVVAVGLLVPLNLGLNSAQYIVLYAAKFGSGFATNTWNAYNNAINTGASGGGMFGANGGNPTGEKLTLIAKPITPDIAPVIQAMSLIDACRYAYWRLDQEQPKTGPDPVPSQAGVRVRAYFVKKPTPGLGDQNAFQEVTAGTNYQDALTFYNNSDIIIRFGEYEPDKYGSELGFVKPLCGDMRIKVTSIADPASMGEQITASMQAYYFGIVRELWFASGGAALDLAKYSDRFIEVTVDNEPGGGPGGNPADLWQCQGVMQGANLPNSPQCANDPPGSQAAQSVINSYQANLESTILALWTSYNYGDNSVDTALTPEIKDRGWAGAGIWYNTLAHLNGAFTDAVTSPPRIQSYPAVMENVREENRKNNSDIDSLDVFNPNIANAKAITYLPGMDQNDIEAAKLLHTVYVNWNTDGSNQADMDKAATGRVFIDMINLVFGTKGLFAMRGQNAAVYPLAQMISLGKSLVNSAIFCISFSIVGGGFAPLTEIANLGAVGAGMKLMASVLSSVALVGLTAGLVLFYVLPFLPFIYFFFAVGTWVQSIFEAMVGVPLWALAHLRLDGDGLSGEAAKDGYFLIFEIFLRPVLTVFGLIAAMIIFTAQVRVLNVIWSITVDNLTGHEGTVNEMGAQVMTRGAIDEFFFTILYTIVVYMMAIASFKLIDRIPDNILRFMGAGVSSYSDINADPTEGLTRYAAFGGMTVGQQVTGALQQTTEGLGGAAASLFGKRGPPG